MKSSLRPSVLVIACLIGSLISVSFPPCRSRSTTAIGSGSIRVESLDASAQVVKLVLIFEEETTSDDFRERSTSWIIFKQYGSNVSIPIGRADPDWELIGTNNLTIWHWKLEKTLYAEYRSNAYQFWSFPFERFAVDICVVSNISRWFSVSTSSSVSSLSTSIDQYPGRYNQSIYQFQFEGCPELSRINLCVSHNTEYQVVVSMLYAILVIILAIGSILPKRMGNDDSNFFMISSTILVFVPVLFFAFRDIAPPYLTLFDTSCLLSAIFYGCLILGKLICKKQPRTGKLKDSKSRDDKSSQQEKERGNENRRVERSILESDIERRISKLDSLFLWTCSFSALGFSVFVGYLKIPVAPYIPVFLLVAFSVAVGYVNGAIFSENFTERVRGWNYLMLGLTIYVPFAAVEFGKSQINMLLQDIPMAPTYFQLGLGVLVPVCYVILSRKMLPEIYESFRMKKGDVTDAILQRSFLGGTYVAFALYQSALVLQTPEISWKTALCGLFTLLFLILLSEKERMIRWLLRLERNQNLVKLESTLIHRRLLKVGFALIVFGIVAFIIVVQFLAMLPSSPLTLFLSIILSLLALFAPLVGFCVLLYVKPRKEKFIIRDDAAAKLPPEEYEALKNLVERLNNLL